MERTVTYFETLDPKNTEITFRLARTRAQELGIRKIVIASTTGATAKKALEFFDRDTIQLVVIPHQWDFHREVNTFPPELATALRNAGHVVHFGTMLFHTNELFESTAPLVMANLLRCFCQGFKVCFEIVLMATDGGHVKSGEPIIAIAGTGRGSDTALVMQAASSQHLKKLRVNEILCKPLNPLNIEELHAAMSREPGR
jgi:uncharacterized protein